MSVILNKKKEIQGIYDSGSNVTLINSKILKDVGAEILRKNKQLFKTISGVQESNNKVSLVMKIHKIEKEVEAYIIKNDNFSYDILLGLDVIKKFKLLQNDDLNIFQRLDDDKLEMVTEKRKNGNFDFKINNSINITEIEEKLSHLGEGNMRQLRTLIEENLEDFARDKYDVGEVKNNEIYIKLMENRYISKKPYRCSLPDQKEIEDQITKLLEKGLIEESMSPFAAPVTLAFKKEDNKRTRLCIDFRELNKILVPEPQPFPRIEDIVVKTRNCKWYTVLDINSAFWSLPVRQKDRYKTAFVTQSGHYQWTRLPFGLKISPAVFQRVLANTIRRCGLQNFCVNYIDDILIFSTNFDDHLSHIRKVMSAVNQEGFRLKLSKCEFAQNSVKYLGHILGNNTVRPHHDNLRSIKDFPTPQSKKNIRQFLGKINFYHKYIPDSTRLLEPLHNLLRDNTPFRWTDVQNRAFEEIKDYLCKSPVLAIFDPNRPTFLFTDASGLGVGAILKQVQDDEELHPVAYFSKKLSHSQKKRKAIYLECLAIKEAIQYWQHWLIGHKFVVISDHKPLENLKIRSRTDEELGDLVYYLSQYEFVIRYSPGKTNQEADALSRNPVLECFENDEDVLRVVNLVSIEDLRQDQEQNAEEFSVIRNTVRKGDLIYKQLRSRQRILVSQDFGLSLIEKIHSSYGHIGPGHMAAKIRPFYYFRRMDALIRDFCKKCDICKRNKTRRCREMGLLSQLGPATKPFEIMSLDTIGGFAGNRSPKKYLHLLVDHFTRYAFVCSSSTQKTGDFIRLLKPILQDHKIKVILADRYPSINSNEFRNFLHRNDVTLIFTAADCPFSNGINERLNQTLVNRIRCKIQEDKKRPWSTIADECVEEYNQTMHSVTKFSPSYLLWGEETSILPKELETTRDLLEDRILAFDNSRKYHNLNKARVDRVKRDHIFNTNDLVYVETGNRLNRNKLDPIRSGPYRILRRVSNTIYELDEGQGLSGSRFYHSSKLLPYYKTAS